MDDKRESTPWDWIVPLLVIAALLVALFATTAARAHSWYDIECCSHQDCAPVTSVEIMQPVEASGLPQLVVTTKVGTAIVPKAYKIRESKDAQMHACMKVHDPNPATRFLCLYLPPGN